MNICIGDVRKEVIDNNGKKRNTGMQKRANKITLTTGLTLFSQGLCGNWP